MLSSYRGLSGRAAVTALAEEKAEQQRHDQELRESVQQASDRGERTFNWSYDAQLQFLPSNTVLLRDHVEVLHLDNNYSLSTLPTSIGGFSKLRWLNVSYCNLTQLPVEVCRLRSLERLYVNNNRLDTLPVEVWALKNLEELHVGNNALRALPGGLLFLPKLREILAENNPLLSEGDVLGAEPADLLPPLYGKPAAAAVTSGADEVEHGRSGKSAGGGGASIRGGRGGGGTLTVKTTSKTLSATAGRSGALWADRAVSASTKRSGGDCVNCCVRFRNYIVFITFHALSDADIPLPYVHYVCSGHCEEQLRERLALR